MIILEISPANFNYEQFLPSQRIIALFLVLLFIYLTARTYGKTLKDLVLIFRELFLNAQELIIKVVVFILAYFIACFLTLEKLPILTQILIAVIDLSFIAVAYLTTKENFKGYKI